jgi:hypothetical protein
MKLTKIALTALVSVLLVDAGVGIVGLGAQPLSGTPTSIVSNQDQTKSDGTQKPTIDLETLRWIDGRIKDAKESIESRLKDDREFVKFVLAWGITIVSGAFLLIVSVFGFVGIKSWSSIKESMEAKINDRVGESIRERSNDLEQIYKQKIQGYQDQAIIASYHVRFSAPQNGVYQTDRPSILPADIQRFVDILSDENADPKLLTQIYDLLSDASHDENSEVVSRRLFEMVSCAGNFSWISNDATRLSKIIDLLRDRNLKSHPARVRAFLKEGTTAPDVAKSAVLYAERIRDTDTVEYLANILGDKSRLRDANETIFALVSLNPKHAWVNEWISGLKQQPRDYNKLVQAAGVAGHVMESLERRKWLFRDLGHDELEQAVDFAANIVSLIVDKGGLFYVVNRKLILFFLWQGNLDTFVVKRSLFFGVAGDQVVSRLCRKLIDGEGIVGIINLMKSTTNYSKALSLEAQLERLSDISVDVGGVPYTIAHRKARFSLRSSEGQDILLASWRTDGGEVKTGVVKRINVPNDLFSRVTSSPPC